MIDLVKGMVTPIAKIEEKIGELKKLKDINELIKLLA